ncbi:MULTISPECIES: hypothetical protein [unclassified Lentimonas]|nr:MULTISPECIES: hypothetical protein [unclassified Lentimonas]CAA6679688.1 Unannotated [Lentimonas sp. CC4]CAA6683546.1 Unannotated [Lentimonas sp. CC6]CAA7077307.1 Unannotated [Lentimonas sp. CC4]CAA7170178.1 Unannotated [Lentimonas sp. CC21]CAA7182434.1 Unannotated [Lentimonas sp. CC8]
MTRTRYENAWIGDHTTGAFAGAVKDLSHDWIDGILTLPRTPAGGTL